MSVKSLGERAFLLDLVEEDNVRVHEEDHDDGWVTYAVHPTTNGFMLSVEYVDTYGDVLSEDYILIPQVGGLNGKGS